MLSFSAGPFALSLERLLLLIALGVALLVGWLYGRRHRISVEPAITAMLLWGVVGARIGFVLLYLEEYLKSPLSIIDIRDGGFLLGSGLLTAAIIAVYHGWRHASVRRPLGAAVAAGALTWGATAGAISMMEFSRPALPDYSLTTIEGGEANLRALSGKPMVVNLWATWCPPCRREMPVLAEAQQQLDDVEFVFVNQGESSSDVARYLNGEQLTLRNVLLDPYMEVAQQVGSQAMPTTLFYDADGNLVDSHLGELSSATLKRSLDRLSTQ